MRTILEHGVRVGLLKVNPFDGLEKIPTATKARYVTDDELQLAVDVGRMLGGPQLIVALALKMA